MPGKLSLELLIKNDRWSSRSSKKNHRQAGRARFRSGRHEIQGVLSQVSRKSRARYFQNSTAQLQDTPVQFSRLIISRYEGYVTWIS